jgi:rod shape-determining protein MreC
MRTRTKGLVALGGVIALMVLLRLVGVLGPMEELLRVLTLPAVRAVAAIGSGVGGMLRTDPEADELKGKLVELEARLAAVTVDYVRLRSLEEENQSLKALTGYLDTSGYDHVPARVIARSIDPQSATVLIDRGSKDGIETGMAVIVGEGLFVGKVTLLKERVSTVTLVADEQSRIAASRAGEHRLFGLVEGRGNHVARLTLVPQAEQLRADDVIVTSGSEDKIPADLVIGLVNDVEGKPTDPFKDASIQPIVQSDRLGLVSVLVPSALRPEGGSP